jgi:hypothetical protein
MLHNTKQLRGYALAASDGDIGHVRDFYFDDKTWVIRYLVADTGSWMTGRLVLITPHVFGTIDDKTKMVAVKLTRKRIEDSPSIESHQPVSRQYEVDYYRYYGWPAYWDGSAMWGFGGYPALVPPSKDEMAAQAKHHHRDDKHLQSAVSVQGYEIHATDGVIGQVSGFMVDDKSWAIRELVVETGHWYAGKEIFIAPAKVTRISYEDSKVWVKLTKADIERTEENKVVHAAHAGRGAASFPRE